MNKNFSPPNYHQLQENEAGEFSLINRLIKILAQPPFSQSQGAINKEVLSEKGRAIVGIGDDCAIIPASILGKYLLTTVDSFIQGRHFLFEISTPEEIGYKGAATATSDIAAMGGQPRFLLINLHLPVQFDVSTLEKLYKGIHEFCSEFQMSVVGGNTSSASEFSLSFTVIGESSNEPLRRSGAQAGDDLWISGILGLSQIGLYILNEKKQFAISNKSIEEAINRYQKPVPRIGLGNKILEAGASAAIDVSDGIFQDAGHIAFQSQVNIELDLAALNPLKVSDQELVELLSSGGDYELLFTSPASEREKIAGLVAELGGGIRLTRCGRVSRADGQASVTIKYGDKLLTSTELVKLFNLKGAGNDHFKKK